MKKLFLSALFIILAAQLSFAQYSREQEELIDLSKTKWQWMADKEADKLSGLFDDQSVLFIWMELGGKIGKSISSEAVGFGIKKQISTKYQLKS